MRPTRDPRRLSLLLALGTLGACARPTTSPPSASAAPTPVAEVLEIVVGEPQVEPPPVAAPGRGARAGEGDDGERSATTGDGAPEPDTLPASWTEPRVPGLSFAEALLRARRARDAHGRLAAPPPHAKDLERKQWFTQTQALIDQASRMYAAAFHAADASREGRIDAIAEAAELDMTMARSLDDAGLAALPAAWRSDPAVASTFEDIAIGPTRRWRDEARVLARQCIESARESAVLTEAARRCAGLRTGSKVTVTRRGADGGAPCACASGDPLCSASLGGWCGAGSP